MPQETQSQIESILQGLQLSDPRLYDILRLLNASMLDVWNKLNPLVAAATIAAQVDETPPAGVEEFFYILTRTSIELHWTTNDPNTRTFELRLKDGIDWDHSTFLLRTPSLSASLNPYTNGVYRFMIRTISASGIYANEIDIKTVDVTIPPMGPISLTATVIDNNVLLRWNEPTSTFNIAYYKLYKGGVLQGTKTGTFTTIFETVAGTYTYGISAVDLAGSESAIATVTTIVNQPPDFVLQDVRLSTFSGTKTNCLLSGGRLLCLINTTETFENHFLLGAELNKPWADPNEQVVSLYPIYIQPAKLTGSYQEVIDYGAAFSNVIITLAWAFEIISGSFSISSTLESSTDGITYAAPVAGPSAFFTTIRYLRFTINSTATDDKSLMWFSDLKIAMAVKQVIDSGTISALASDASGTQVNFNIAFKAVNSITLDAGAAKKDITAIYDFVGIPNPTNFKVYVFDAIGQRVDANVSWKARGVV